MSYVIGIALIFQSNFQTNRCTTTAVSYSLWLQYLSFSPKQAFDASSWTLSPFVEVHDYCGRFSSPRFCFFVCRSVCLYARKNSTISGSNSIKNMHNTACVPSLSHSICLTRILVYFCFWCRHRAHIKLHTRVCEAVCVCDAYIRIAIIVFPLRFNAPRRSCSLKYHCQSRVIFVWMSETHFNSFRVFACVCIRVSSFFIQCQCLCRWMCVCVFLKFGL